MSVTVDANGVTLTGDGFGVNWARKQLAAAPATAVKMQFVYRAYFTDGATTAVAHSAKGWDSAGFLGLGFDNLIYDFSVSNTLAPTNFLGVLTTTNPYTTGPAYDASRKVFDSYFFGGADHNYDCYFGGTVSGVTQKIGRLDGIGTVLNEQTDFSSSSVYASMFGFPYNTSDGAKATFMWEVWGSAIDNTVYMRWVRDYSSLAEGDAMFSAMGGKSVGTGAASILENTIHGDVTSNWRNSDGTMNFPRWLKFKCALPEYSLRLKYFKVRYLDANDTVVG